MKVQMFGPLEVWADGESLDVGPLKRRAVLAALAVAPGRLVPFDVLVDRVWGESPPANPTATLYPYIARLRRALEPAGVRIVSRTGGYLCDVSPDLVDLVRFQLLVREAEGAESSAAVELLREALALWRGMPLADFSGEWVTRIRETLAQERQSALMLLAENHLRRGKLAQLADELRAASLDYRLSEPLAGYVIRALSAAGRRAEALDYYADFRRHLVDELGEEPGDDLKHLHQQLLRRDPSLASEAEQPYGASAAPVVPRQLPGVARHFVGRESELRVLDELLTSADNAYAVVISAIAGTAGIGKTALAVYWAHRSAERFPDGQLYVNLRGFDPAGSPMTPADAVRGFLDALGVRPDAIPYGLDAQAGLFRSLLAGRRMLLVLDNARDVEQVRPLLPGASGCLAVVTSRNRLTGLVAEHGAHPIALDLLGDSDAEELLVRHLGHERVAAEPEPVGAVIEHCARLPLALAIAAAQAANDPGRLLAVIAAELSDARQRLDVLDTDDPLTTVRAVLSWSYDAQTPVTQWLFRLLGLHPGPDISAPAAASLAGTDVPEATRSLDELRQANLITEHAPGRYAFHDLLRAYATELGQLHDTESERRTAQLRMLDHYLHTAHTAAMLFNPHWDQIALATPQPGVTAESLADHEQAHHWLTTEHQVLVAAIDLASRSGFHTHTWQLVWSIDNFLDRSGHWLELMAKQEIALKAAQALGNPSAQARAHRALAHIYSHIGRDDEAHSHFADALDLQRRLSDPIGLARTHHLLALLLRKQQKHAEALIQAQEALELFRTSGDRVGQARALNTIGGTNGVLGNLPLAITNCEQAVTLQQELGDQHGEANSWDALGHAHHQLRQFAEAVRCYERALSLYRDAGNDYGEADTLIRLGDSHYAAGDCDGALRRWRQALDFLEGIKHPNADRLRSKLSDVSKA